MSNPTPESMKVAREIIDGKSDPDGYLFGDLHYQEQIKMLALALDLAVREAEETPCKKCGQKPADRLS